MAEGTRMQQRRATESVWIATDYVLADGELGITTDTGIIKIGDGVTTWSELTIAFDSQYLPALGKAADSELLDGISSTGFIQTSDVDTDPTPDTVAMRLSDGRLKIADAIDANDAVPFGQVAIATGNEQVAGTVTANTTIVEADVGKMIMVENASVTTHITVTIPENATLPLPVGSWIDICATASGGAKIAPSGANAIRGFAYVMPNFDIARILKIATNEWLMMSIGRSSKGNKPQMRLYRNTNASFVSDSSFRHGIPYTTIDASQTYNPDNEWFAIPGTGLNTSRRVIVNQSGEYEVLINFAGTHASVTHTQVAIMTGDNVAGNTLATMSATLGYSVSWRGYISAGVSVGGVHIVPTGTNTGLADSANGYRQDFRIVRVGD
jgi:hypothetical protein